MRWGISLVLGLAMGVSLHDVACAQSGSVMSALSWVRLPGTEQCPTAPELASRVEALLNRPTFVAATDADLSIEGRVESMDGQLRAHVVVADRDGTVLGQRVMDEPSADCAGLSEKIALVIALTVQSRDRLVPLPSDLVIEGDKDPAQVLLADLQQDHAGDSSPQAASAPGPLAEHAERPPSHLRENDQEEVETEVGYALGIGAIASLGELRTPGLGPMVLGRAVISDAWAVDLRATYQLSPTTGLLQYSVAIHKAYATVLLWWTPAAGERGDVSLALGADGGSTLVLYKENGKSQPIATQPTASLDVGLRLRATAIRGLAVSLELMAVAQPWPTDVNVYESSVASGLVRRVFKANSLAGRLAIVFELRP